MYLTTHPMRLFLEQERGLEKDYFTQKLVDLVVYGGKFTITEPSHTFNDFLLQIFFNMFDMLAFSDIMIHNLQIFLVEIFIQIFYCYSAEK